MTKPFVSVLIDTYNHERFIEEAVVIVLEQNFPPAEREILVVDDGSTDQTPAILKKFEPEIRILRKENGGQASAFNAGIPECRGEIVAFLDGDDWWTPTKLETVTNEFAEHHDVGVLGHGLFETDECGHQNAALVPDRCYVTYLRTVSEGIEFLPMRAFLGTSRLAVRTSVLGKVIPLPVELTIEADEFMATLATAESGARIIDKPLTNYRLHSGNLFQFAEWSAEKARRKYAALACLANELPRSLAKTAVPSDVATVLAGAARVDADRLRLSLGEGWSWQTVRTERAAYRLAYGRRDLGYRIFHGLVLGIASLLPPSRFYRLRSWYSSNGLARMRKRFGEGLSTDTVTRRRELS
jgi:glycosyltransferase involved in cell wall biosynthesis